MSKVKSTLIILTRNEIAGLKQVLKAIPRHKIDEVFAVDFNSTDGTKEYFTRHGIRVISQKKPGRAEAFYLGAQRAKGEYLIFFSPDGNEDPRDIPKLIKLLDDGADLAIASRFLPTSRNEEDDQLLKFRKWANQAFSLAANIFFKHSHHPYVTDTINGYRAIRRKKLNQLKLDAQGFAVEYQMTMRAMKKGFQIAEFPTHEGDRIGGESGSKAIPTGLQFVGYLIKEIVNHT